MTGDSLIELEASPESPLAFYRDYVAANRPVIVRGGCRHWKAFRDWQDDQYFRSKCGDRQVTVTLTPDGYADALKLRPDRPTDLFVMPHELKMTVNQLLDELQSPSDNRVAYYQMQNSNLTDRDEWSFLLDDLEELEWAAKAFGSKPDAVNLWMGDKRAVTSSECEYSLYHFDSVFLIAVTFSPTHFPHRNSEKRHYETNIIP